MYSNVHFGKDRQKKQNEIEARIVLLYIVKLPELSIQNGRWREIFKATCKWRIAFSSFPFHWTKLEIAPEQLICLLCEVRTSIIWRLEYAGWSGGSQTVEPNPNGGEKNEHQSVHVQILPNRFHTGSTPCCITSMPYREQQRSFTIFSYR